MSAPIVPAILNVVLLIILLLALGLSGTGFGLFAHNNVGNFFCPLNYSLRSSDDNRGNFKLCNASLAGYIIATICIAAVTLMKFIKLVYGKSVNIVGKIIQIALLVISGVLLIISGASIRVGWDQTCENIDDYYRERNEGSNNPLITCTSDDSEISGIFKYQEMVGSIACAFLSMTFVTIATVVAIVNAILSILSRNTAEEVEKC